MKGLTMPTATKSAYTSDGSGVEFKPEQTFDRNRMRHQFEGNTSVLHCHHYATLFTQLAMDAGNFNGPALLVRSAADSFQEPLEKYFKKHNLNDVVERIDVAEQFFSFMGLGSIRLQCTSNNAEVTMKHSHVDEGWLKKFGKSDVRVNYIGEGFIKAACAAIFDLPDPHGVQVTEQQSLVTGAPDSKFTANWK